MGIWQKIKNWFNKPLQDEEYYVSRNSTEVNKDELSKKTEQ